MSKENLRKLKVGYRAKYLLGISLPFAKGEINEMELHQKPPEEQKKILLSLYGVGPQLVNYLMLDIFHNFDFLEHVPLWGKKSLKKDFWHQPGKPCRRKKTAKIFWKIPALAKLGRTLHLGKPLVTAPKPANPSINKTHPPLVKNESL